MLNIGVNTFLLTSPFTTERTDIISRFREWGCDAVEIALEDASHIDPHAVKQALDEHGLVCSSICAAMGEGRDLRGSDAEQQNAVAYIRATLDAMTVLDCPVLAGPLYSTVGRAEQTPRPEYQRQWELVVGHLKSLGAYAERLDRKLALEPLNRYETDFINTCEQGLGLVDAVDSPAVGLLLDTYHMNIEEKDSAAAIRKAGKRPAATISTGTGFGMRCGRSGIPAVWSLSLLRPRSPWWPRRRPFGAILSLPLRPSPCAECRS